MPTYDYACDACGHAFEEFQSITAKSLRKCPKCSKSKLKRLIGIGAGVIFKGSGFYETDYRSDSYKKAAKADKESKTDKKSDSTTKTKSNSSSTAKSTNDSSTTKPADKPKD
jgi:putative FmdB family regulatory protein